MTSHPPAALPPAPLKIAVIGAGIAGMGAAWLLARNHHVTLIEKESRLGGHANTVDIDYDGTPIAVDTGFIVYNHHNYPNLIALFDRLGVATEPSDMSFSVSQQNGAFEWAWTGGDLSTLFAQKRNLVSPRFFKMVRDIMKFRKQGYQDLEAGEAAGVSLRDYVGRLKLSDEFVYRYLVPFGAAIWSTPGADILDFPAESFLRFLANHRLLANGDTAWRTVSGGSRSYVTRLAEDLEKQKPGSTVKRASPVAQLNRDEEGVTVTYETGAQERFDHAVLATHSDQALGLLADPSDEERQLLSALGYEGNTAWLHRDPALMPKRPKAWAAWNAMAPGDPTREGFTKPVYVSYWMNRLQNIDRAKPLFVTLNPEQEPRADLTFGRYTYAHPQFDQAAIAAQGELQGLQGQRRTWFCGAYCGYGFHEDGLKAGLAVAEQLGGALRPWAEAPDAPEPRGAEGGETFVQAAE